MKFDLKYPNTKAGDEPQTGMIKGWGPPDVCCHCKALTDWVDITWGWIDVFVCSDECLTAFNKKVDEDLRKLNESPKLNI